MKPMNFEELSQLKDAIKSASHFTSKRGVDCIDLSMGIAGENGYIQFHVPEKAIYVRVFDDNNIAIWKSGEAGLMFTHQSIDRSIKTIQLEIAKFLEVQI